MVKDLFFDIKILFLIIKINFNNSSLCSGDQIN